MGYVAKLCGLDFETASIIRVREACLTLEEKIILIILRHLVVFERRETTQVKILNAFVSNFIVD